MLPTDYLNGRGNENVEFLALTGCPRPAVRDFGNLIRVIVLDSQWWLQDEGLRPEPEDII